MLQLNLHAYYTIIRKEIIRFLRIWVQTLLPPAITMTLYFLIFGQLIGPRIGEMSGFDYIQYIAPGLIMMAIITNSYGNVVSSFYGARLQRYIEELLVSPTSNFVILLGYITAGIARGICVGIVVTCVALFFTHLSVQHVWVTLSIVILTATVFSLAGFTNAIFAKNFDDISIIPTFVLTPLTYLGGVFYSISLLPDFWQKVSHLNPILFMVNTFRYGILGASDVKLSVAYAMIAGFIVALTMLNLYLLRSGRGLRE